MYAPSINLGIFPNDRKENVGWEQRIRMGNGEYEWE